MDEASKGKEIEQKKKKKIVERFLVEVTAMAATTSCWVENDGLNAFKHEVQNSSHRTCLA